MVEQSPAEAIFFEALEKGTPKERAAYLDAACGDDRNLRQRVERLLAAYPQVGSFLEPPPQIEPGAAEAATIPPDDECRAGSGLGESTSYRAPAEGVGSVIASRYKLRETLGQGGMGAVFMAQQTQPVKRLVALKLIKLGMDSKQVLTRFETERQALALMDHPNIAKVLDAGATDSGRPFFVMELVKGVPITRFCDECQLAPRERLELFIPVCQAIQHAHQKGVIHRDIKPTNVLVALYDDRPVPKVIDFGVAKATGSQLTDASLVTGFGALVGTPEYMSPEQAQLNQLDIDTRSDVYALGVLLYELLTGTTPIDRKRLGQDALFEVLRVIREEEPPRPSARLSTSEALASIAATRRTEPAKLTKLMRGELDWIVMRALEKDRARRYETAGNLARDVDRYLHDEPVEACPPSLRYRSVKFCRRNRGAVLAAGLVLLALVGGTVGTTWGLLHAEWARQAESEQRQIAQVKERDAEVEKGKALAAAREEKRAKDDAVKAKEAEAKERQKAEAERDAKDKALVRAEGLRLTAQSSAELQTDPSLGLLLAIEAARRAPSKEANQALVAALEACHEERAIFGHQGEVLSARFTSDGKRIMSCARDGTARFWDAASGTQLFATPAFGPLAGQLMADAVLSPDGKYFVTLYAGVAYFERNRKQILYTDRVARLWDAATGKQLAVFRGHQGRVRTAAFSADTKRLVTASDDTAVRIWEIPSGKPLAVLQGHACTPYSARFSHDGRHVLTISSRSVAQNPTSWASAASVESDPEQIRAPEPNDSQGRAETGAVRCIGYASIGVSVSPFNDRENALARVWDAESGKQVATIFKPRGAWGKETELPCFGHFSPDGNRVALGFMDEVQVWDVAAGKMLFKVKHDGMGGEDHAVWSPDGRRFATIRGNYVSIWDAANGRELTTLRGHQSTLRTVSFSPDGKLALTTSWDRTARVWNAETGEETAVLRGHKSRVNTAALSSDGLHVVTGAADGTVRVWWLDPPKNQARPLAEPIVNFSVMALSPDGNYLATGTNDFFHPGARIWDTATGKLLHQLKAPREGILARLPDRDGFAEVRSVAFSPDGRRLLSIADEEQIRIRKSGFTLLEALRFLSKPKSPPDGRDSGSNQEEVLPFTPARIWDVATGKQVAALPAGDSSLSCACFSADGRKVLTANGDQKRCAVYSNTGTMISGGTLADPVLQTFVRVCDAATGKELLRLPHQGQVLRAEFSVDGRRILASACSNRYPSKDIKVWDAETGTLLFAVEKTSLEDVACFAPDGKRIVVFSSGIRILDATSGTELARSEGSDVWVQNWKLRQAVLSPFSPDGKKLLAYGKEGLGLLDVQTGKQLVAFRGHSGAVMSALFSTDGRFVVTASDDQTARVWDAATGKEVHLLRHKASVQFAVMTPDGRRVATASDTVRVWDLEPLPIAIQRKPRELSPYERERFGIK
jgi:WD40 repeat protein/serine/threonine protein kinase